MNTISEMPTELVRQLFKQTLGTRVELTGYEIVNQQYDYMVFIAQLERPAIKVAVKLAGRGAVMASDFESTTWIHRMVTAQTTIPVAEILAVNMSFEAWPWRYMISRYMAGDEWVDARTQMTPEELDDAYRQIGNAVGQLHQIYCEQFGEFGAGRIEDEPSYLQALTRRAKKSIKSSLLGDVFLEVLRKHQSLFVEVSEACVGHEDIHQHNILFERRREGWRLAAILDFDKAWAGHHEIDLARMEFWRGMTNKAFWEAYEDVRLVEPEYEQRRAIYQFLWCLEYARNSAEHINDTQRLCAEYGFPFSGKF